MRGTFKFKGNKKLGNEFDPDLTGEDGFSFEDYDTTTSEAGENIYGGSDAVEGAGSDSLKNEFDMEKYGTQNTQRMPGVGDTSFTSDISKVPTKDLGTFKAFFPNDPEVRNLIDEVIESRQTKPTQNLAKHKNVKTGEVITSPMVGQPQGKGTAPINESQAPKYYTQSEINKQLSGLQEELKTIDDYLNNKDIELKPEVRTALADEGFEIMSNIEIEKAKMGVSIEQEAAANRYVEAMGDINTTEQIEDLKNNANKSLQDVNDAAPNNKVGVELTEELIESGTIDVGKQTNEGFVDKTFDQTRRSTGGQSLTTKKGVGKSYIRDMKDSFPDDVQGILGDDSNAVQKQKDPKTGKQVTASFDLNDQENIKLNKATKDLKLANEALEYHNKLGMKLGLDMVDIDFTAETTRLKNNIINAKSRQTKALNNKQVVAADEVTVKIETPVGGGGPKVTIPSASAGAYGQTAEYLKELESQNLIDRPKVPGEIRFNKSKSVTPGGRPEFSVPSSPNKITDLTPSPTPGNIENSPSYKKKFTESYNRIAKDLTESAGGIFDAKNIDPAIAKRAAASAATLAAWYAKKNPGVGAGLMILGGLKNLDKKKDYTR